MSSMLCDSRETKMSSNQVEAQDGYFFTTGEFDDCSACSLFGWLGIFRDRSDHGRTSIFNVFFFDFGFEK